MKKQSIGNKVKSVNKLGLEETKDLYKKISGKKLKKSEKISSDIEIDVIPNEESMKAIVVREEVIKKAKKLKKYKDRGDKDILIDVREKNFGNILNDILSQKMDERYCIEHDIEYIEGLTGKEMMMLKQAERAMQGDLNSAKFIVERIDGKLKNVNESKSINIKSTLEEFLKGIDKNG